MTKAYTYARISADYSQDEHGVTSQLRQCHQYAERHGWEIGKDYIDNDISAYSGAARPAFEQLIHDMEAGLIPILICWDIDRLGRRIKDLHRIVEAASKNKTQIITINAGAFDLTSASGEMHVYLLGTFAQFESRHLSERAKASQHDRALRGLWRGGPIPYGYKPLGKGVLEINEEHAQWLRQWREWLLAGDSIMSMLRRTKAAVPEDHPLQKMNAYVIRKRLSNPATAGLLVEHGEVTGKASWEPIFTESEHQDILAILRDPSRRTSQGNERKHQGSGVYACQSCGSKMSTHKHPHKKGQRRYKCRNDCTQIDQDPVDALVDEVIIQYLSIPENTLFAGRDDETSKRVEELRNERLALVRRKDDLGVLFAEGAIDTGQLTSGSKSIQDQIAVIDRRLSAIGESNPVVDLSLDADNVRERWHSLDADKRALVISELLTVEIVKAKRGGSYGPPESRVRIGWK
ncbi:hypothetical protein CDES_14040 [Corynebacterium deserti GIMN1.010]|uniref:Uncharacterized protein n=1 Tax=Corynebacterium deserti GIMN1.010 TaxID=931089 RepID=A0A0M3QAD9_9CORY|nr:recombinase family protein [Corynebacterium deserti]ALC07133.1 hypothetical protein CDES_14040 [Corynebacterium deserti GIMN1.010]